MLFPKAGGFIAVQNQTSDKDPLFNRIFWSVLQVMVVTILFFLACLL